MIEMVQQSGDWFAARLGKATASRMADLSAKTKNGWGAARAAYMAQIIAERLTGEVAETFVSGAMYRGADLEPEARAAYEFRTGADVATVGFVEHPTIAMSGASPDGLIGDDGLLEVKCPNTGTHIDTLLSGAIPPKHVAQITWQMACTGRQWCDFVSYDPRLPEHLRMFVARLERDDDRIAALEAMVVEFLAEVDAKIEALSRAYQTRAAA